MIRGFKDWVSVRQTNPSLRGHSVEVGGKSDQWNMSMSDISGSECDSR
jgi:hypothetical protein